MANQVADSFVASNPATTQESFQLQETSSKVMDKPSLDMEILSKKIQKLHIGLVLGSVLIGSMLLVIVAITIAFSVEISELKSSDSSPDQQNLGAITDMNTLSQLQTFANISSSLEVFSQQLFERVSAVENRTQLLNSSLDMLSLGLELAVENSSSLDVEGLFQNISFFKSSIQQVNTSALQQLNSVPGEVQQTLASLVDNMTQVLDTISQQLLPNIALLQQTNSSLSQQIRDAENETQQIMPGLLGQLEIFPAPSCADLSPTLPSGNYFVRSSNGSAVSVYCDMNLTCGGLTGGWQRLVDLDFSNNNEACPSGYMEQIGMVRRTCQPSSTATGCISTDPFSTSGTAYSRVCGRVIGTQFGTPDAFSPSITTPSLTIDSEYLDGISLTHGSSPREHIWSFAAGITAMNTDAGACPCNTGSSASPPSFVGNDYFCESATTSSADGVIYESDPLWDGSDCQAVEGPCCTFNTPPWFYKELPQSTFDDIELRSCRNEGPMMEGTPIGSIALYVHV